MRVALHILKTWLNEKLYLLCGIFAVLVRSNQYSVDIYTFILFLVHLWKPLHIDIGPRFSTEGYNLIKVGIHWFLWIECP